MEWIISDQQKKVEILCAIHFQEISYSIIHSFTFCQWIIFWKIFPECTHNGNNAMTCMTK